ncbi:MAG: phosphatase PAP2 family protein [Candidatus Micrarchaeia archaeon]
MSALTIMFVNASRIGINLWAFGAAKALESSVLTAIMSLLAPSFLVVLPVLVLYMLYKRDLNVYSFVIAGVLLYIISDTIKLIVREPRPCHYESLGLLTSVHACESSFSFPSNHASVLTGLAFFTKNYKYIRILYIIWLVLVLFGRVYLGVHYFTDVLAGVALSLVIAYIVYRYRKRLNAFADKIVSRIINLHLVQG